jgi:hypothetical protein
MSFLRTLSTKLPKTTNERWSLAMGFAASPCLRSLRCHVVPVSIALSLMSSGALAAPSQLYGKSVIVSWQEDRQQTTGQDAQIRSISASGEFSVYISDAGRPFSRFTMTVSSARGRRTGTRTNDAVQGEGSARSFNFHGSAMSASMPRGSAGATQVLVTFDGGFQSCSARVVTGKASGAQSTRSTSIITGAEVEIFSVKTSGESCRVQNGNVFGN